jgi:hypothetical protein
MNSEPPVQTVLLKRRPSEDLVESDAVIGGYCGPPSTGAGSSPILRDLASQLFRCYRIYTLPASEHTFSMRFNQHPALDGPARHPSDDMQPGASSRTF